MFSKWFWLTNFCVDGNNSAPSWRMILQSWNRRTRTVKYYISSIRTNCALSLFGLYVAINPIIFHCFLYPCPKTFLKLFTSLSYPAVQMILISIGIFQWMTRRRVQTNKSYCKYTSANVVWKLWDILMTNDLGQPLPNDMRTWLFGDV